MNENLSFEVAVIGAGLAGLNCAKHLMERGMRVVVLEKSRGVGGRVATRRREKTCFDHGLRYLENQGELTQALINSCLSANIIQLWQGSVYTLTNTTKLCLEPGERYVAPEGMSAIAKFLAKDIEIWFQSRLIKISYDNHNNAWELNLESTAPKPQTIKVRAIIMAIPAPQALAIINACDLKNLEDDFLAKLKQVQFSPCITVMAGYEQKMAHPWAGLRLNDHPELAWICHDSSKRIDDQSNIYVFQSNSIFAEKYIDTENLDSVGEKLINAAGEIIPGLLKPQWQDVHRWRYAFPSCFLGEPYLITNSPLPLICAGDWATGNLVEGALNSGLKSALALKIS